MPFGTGVFGTAVFGNSSAVPAIITGVPTPPNRVLIIPSENRVLVVQNAIN